jgi:PAS domain S-box-containing protein
MAWEFRSLLSRIRRLAGRVKGVFPLEWLVSQRQVERAKGERDIRLRIPDATPGLLAYIDPRHHLVFANAVFQRWLGLTPAPIEGRHLSEVVGEEVCGILRPHVEAALSGRAVSFDARMPDRQGGERHVRAFGTPDIDAEGRPQGVVILMLDVTAEKEAFAELRRTETRFRALTEAKTAFAEAGLDFEAASGLVAERMAELIGDCCVIRVLSRDGTHLEPVAAHHRDPQACAWLKGLVAPLPLEADLFETRAFRDNRLVLASGFSRERLVERAEPEWRELLSRFGPASVLASPMRGRGGPIGVVVLARGDPGEPFREEDVRLAEALASRAAVTLESARLYEAAREASRTKDEFLATLSHELRTPLNAIVGWAHLLRSGDLDEPTRLKAVETINRNAEIQARMIGDVVDVSRMVAGKLRVEAAPVDLAAVVRESLDAIRPAAAAKGVEIRESFDGSAGAIRGDTERLQQVLWNLLSNAMRFTPADGVLRVSVRAGGRFVEVAVEDEGPGIDPAFLPFVFDRFRQADSSSTRSHGGLGLGLALVRHLVELHGGEVEAGNREGGGAVFTVRLPRQGPAVRVAMSTLAPAAAFDLPAPPGKDSVKGVRVLAVDDDPGTREVLGALLGRWGAEVALASSAREGFEQLLSRRPQVLLVDIEMPEEDGYSFVRRVRQLPPEQGGRVPAAALTAYAGAEDRARALRAGFEAHVPKPVEPGELMAVIAELAGSAAAR